MTVVARNSHLVTRVLAATMVTLGLAFSVATVNAPPAHAGRMYVERPCIIKAASGAGLKGNGCNLYGIAKWVDTSRRPPFPMWAWNTLMSCAGGAAVPLISLWWTGAGSMVVLAASCVAPAVAQALMR